MYTYFFVFDFGTIWNNKINTKKPFLHPVIISSMKECFFTASQTSSYADKYAAQFTSSIKEGPKKDELEVPIAMLCLIATTVCFYCSFSWDFLTRMLY